MAGDDDVVPIRRNDSDPTVLQINFGYHDVAWVCMPQIHGILTVCIDHPSINRAIEMYCDGLQVREVYDGLVNPLLSEPQHTANRSHDILSPMPLDSMK